jgi:hypothetical protein
VVAVQERVAEGLDVSMETVYLQDRADIYEQVVLFLQSQILQINLLYLLHSFSLIPYGGNFKQN